MLWGSQECCTYYYIMYIVKTVLLLLTPLKFKHFLQSFTAHLLVTTTWNSDRLFLCCCCFLMPPFVVNVNANYWNCRNELLFEREKRSQYFTESSKRK